MDEESQLHILVQLSNLELYVALYGVVIGGLFALATSDDYKGANKTELAWRKAGAVLCALAAVLLVVWLAAALILRFTWMVVH
jgi:hypothetical protein